MRPITISEQELSLGWNCPTKILHARENLPKEGGDASFEEWAKSEARKVAALARLLFDDVISTGPVLAALVAGKTVAHVELAARGVTAYIDYLNLHEGEIRLFGVTSKVLNPALHEQQREFATVYGSIRSEWRACLRRLVIRAMVLQECFPTLKVRPFLIAPLDGAQGAHDGLHARVERLMRGGPDDPALRAEARRLLGVVDVRRECMTLLPTVRARVHEIRVFVQAPLTPVNGYHCRDCPFRGGEGFARCWGPLAKVDPHVLDVGLVYFAQDAEGNPVVDAMAAAGKASALEIPSHAIRGAHAPRINLQLQSLRLGREILRPELAQEYATLGYPTTVRFLDLESLRSVLPARAGGGVNRLALFSFSLHTLTPGQSFQHTDWLHVDSNEDPNLAFIAALRAAVGSGDEGPILIWTEYERNCFTEVVSECLLDGRNTPAVRWLLDLLQSGRLVDQHAWCLRHYCHPRANGRTSLKATLAAAWSEDSPVKLNPVFSGFSPDIDPYAALKQQGSIADGCGAMTGYLRLLAAPPASRAAIAADLRRYNAIDTLAQVYLHQYWAWRLGLSWA